ncbi:MAG: gluconate 2-dehydrogenase subunit 3 family protein [Archangium sp.]|nr:gluconate 2-dehydrogenase subunit 3 family protein [Archangium sp.]
MKRGLVGTALLAVGGGGWLALRSSTLLPAPSEGLLALSVREYSVVAALAGRLIPARAGFPTVEALKVPLACDRILTQVDVTARDELKQLLMLFENALAGFLLGGRTRPFTELSGDEQEAVLVEWRDSSLALRRTGFLALRGLVMAAYYGNPLVWPALQYEGPPPGVYNPQAPVWKGGGQPRPAGNGVFTEPESEGGGTP